MDTERWVLLAVGAVVPWLIFVCGRLFPVPKKPETGEAPFRPPSWLFGVAWAVIVVGLSASAAYSSAKCVPAGCARVFVLVLAAFVLLACSWLYLYYRGHQRAAAGTLLLCSACAVVLVVVALLGSTRLYCTWAPALLLVWSCFAAAINVYESFILGAEPTK